MVRKVEEFRPEVCFDPLRDGERLLEGDVPVDPEGQINRVRPEVAEGSRCRNRESSRIQTLELVRSVDFARDVRALAATDTNARLVGRGDDVHRQNPFAG